MKAIDSQCNEKISEGLGSREPPETDGKDETGSEWGCSHYLSSGGGIL